MKLTDIDESTVRRALAHMPREFQTNRARTSPGLMRQLLGSGKARSFPGPTRRTLALNTVPHPRWADALPNAVAAATRLGRRLLVVGTGPEEERLRAAAGPTVEFLGWRSDAEVAELYARCRALLFPTVEDFGITPLEAMAAGRPVIALGQGGALETVVPPGSAAPPTGLLFPTQ